MAPSILGYQGISDARKCLRYCSAPTGEDDDELRKSASGGGAWCRARPSRLPFVLGVCDSQRGDVESGECEPRGDHRWCAAGRDQGDVDNIEPDVDRGSGRRRLCLVRANTRSVMSGHLLLRASTSSADVGRDGGDEDNRERSPRMYVVSWPAPPRVRRYPSPT